VESLKELRRRKGWNQRDLAKAAGIGQDTVSSVESGRQEPRPSTLKKLARALGVEIAELYGEASQTAPTPFSLEWARSAGDTEFYRSIIEVEDTDRLVGLLVELRGFVQRQLKRVLRERNSRVFEDVGPEPLPGEHDLLRARLTALRAEIRHRRPPFARLRISREGNEAHWLISPDKWEQYRDRVDEFFEGEEYQDIDARGAADVPEETLLYA
jgi:transcriptional regulator with XRE-family HTH domain